MRRALLIGCAISLLCLFSTVMLQAEPEAAQSASTPASTPSAAATETAKPQDGDSTKDADKTKEADKVKEADKEKNADKAVEADKAKEADKTKDALAAKTKDDREKARAERRARMEAKFKAEAEAKKNAKSEDEENADDAKDSDAKDGKKDKAKANGKAKAKAEKAVVMEDDEDEDEASVATDEEDEADAKASTDKKEKLAVKKDAKKDVKEADDEDDEDDAPSVAKKDGKKPLAKFGIKGKFSVEISTEKKADVVCFTLHGNYPEGVMQPGVFGELQPTLALILQRMDAAAADKSVAAVWLKIENLQMGRGKIFELRQAITRLRKAGKPVYAELTSASGPEYLLASSCEEIIMPPSGLLIVPGVRAEVTFYKGLFDKLGLEFDSLQMGKYKGAMEPYTREKMSEPLRESLEAIVDDTYENFVSTVADDRHILDFQVKSLLDKGLFTAETAKKAGLIDEVAYSDEFEEQLKKKLKVDALDIVTNYKKKKIDADFSGLSGMMKFTEMMMGGKPTDDHSKKPKIAIVYAVGPIVEGKSTSDMFGNSSVGANTIIAALHKAEENPKVSAVVLRIDSPGGSATASDLIWRETVRMKKPIIASMSDVAGSGGYYIAMGAKKIYAAPGTLTGSIGVIGGKMVTRGLFDKIGLNTEVISRGANSGALSSSQPFTPEERKAWTSLLEETYHQFVGKAAEGRKMPYEKLEEMAQGRVYTGRMAKQLGLVDELGTMNDAIVAAKEAAGLKADAEVDLLQLPAPRSMFEQLFGAPSSDADMESLLPDWLKVAAQASTLRGMFSEPMLFWMPYDIKMK